MYTTLVSFHEKDVHGFRPEYEKGDPGIGIRDENLEAKSAWH